MRYILGFYMIKHGSLITYGKIFNAGERNVTTQEMEQWFLFRIC